MRLDRGDAEAAAERVLADYRRQQQGTTQRVAAGGRLARWATVLLLAAFGAALGAFVGALRDQSLAGGIAMAMAGLVLGLITVRR